MATGMALGGRDEAPPPPKPWGGKGLEGEGAPTFGGLVGTAGLGLTSGGTWSDMSAEEKGEGGHTKGVLTDRKHRHVRK